MAMAPTIGKSATPNMICTERLPLGMNAAIVGGMRHSTVPTPTGRKSESSGMDENCTTLAPNSSASMDAKDATYTTRKSWRSATKLVDRAFPRGGDVLM